MSDSVREAAELALRWMEGDKALDGCESIVKEGLRQALAQQEAFTDNGDDIEAMFDIDACPCCKGSGHKDDIEQEASEPVAWVQTSSVAGDFREPHLEFYTNKPKGFSTPLFTHPNLTCGEDG